jgi:putative oxidoreductase
MSLRAQYLLLEPAARLEDFALVLARVAMGIFLVHGVWDNITSAERMAEFVDFMHAHNFPQPGFWAPFSVYTQFAAGTLAILGLCTRWAGLVIATTFIVALYGVHWEQSFREWWPALSLVLIGLVFATRGGGRLSADALLGNRAQF